MPEIEETRSPARELTDRIQHAETVAQGIETFKRGCARIMCKTCLGSGGWGCGPDAMRCEKCNGTGDVEVPVRARHVAEVQS